MPPVTLACLVCCRDLAKGPGDNELCARSAASGLRAGCLSEATGHQRGRLRSSSFLSKLPHAHVSSGRPVVHACGGFWERVPPRPGSPGSAWGRECRVRAVPCGLGPRQCRPAFSQLVYMGFDAAAAEAALRVFRGNVQLAAQTLAHNGGSLPSDLRLSAEDSSATPPTSPSDSAGGSAISEDRGEGLSARAEAGRRGLGRQRLAGAARGVRRRARFGLLGRCGAGGPSWS